MKTLLPALEARNALNSAITVKFGDRVEALVRHEDGNPEDWTPIQFYGEYGIQIAFQPRLWTSNYLDLDFDPWSLRSRHQYGPVESEVEATGVSLSASFFKTVFKWRCSTSSLQNFSDIDELVFCSKQQALLVEIAEYAVKFVEALSEEHAIGALVQFTQRPSVTVESSYNGATRMWAVRSRSRLPGHPESDLGILGGRILRARFRDWCDEHRSGTDPTRLHLWKSILFDLDGVKVKGKKATEELVGEVRQLLGSKGFVNALWPEPEQISFEDWHAQWEAAGKPVGADVE